MEHAELARQRLSVIGCGNMGRAIVEGVCATGGIPPESIWVYDVDKSKCRTLAERFHVAVLDTLREAAAADLLLLALKPQAMREVLSSLGAALSTREPQPLVISVAAGVRLEELRALLGSGPHLLRVMSNTPALIGKGMTAIFGASAEHVRMAERLFSQLGRTVVLDSEALLDCATGLSGSGPPARMH
jgi:pyrroline-5-carboxylate reductase